MDQWLGLADSYGSNESTKKTVDKLKRKSKYDDSFLQYGFTCSCEDGVEKPLCLICNETLSVESLKLSKLINMRNLRTSQYSILKNFSSPQRSRSGSQKFFHYE